MGLNQDRDDLERDIAQLRALLESQPGLPAETRVAALAALVQSRASLLASDTLMSAMHTAEGDVAGPLATALHAFVESADRLSQRLPDY